MANDHPASESAPSGQAQAPRSLLWGAVLLGVALSGFFDGILLHQVLRWHHLLSGLQDPRWLDLERQVFADGMFHVLMYLVAAVALAMLWGHRESLCSRGLGRRIPADVLLGFGGWNFADVVGFHWMAGLHRIRMDSPQPMLWDLLWLGAFGVVPFAIGLWLRRGADASGPGADAGHKVGAARGSAAWAILALAVGLAGYWASRPPPNETPMVLVLYPPGTPGATIFRGLHDAGARVLWVNASGTLWAVDAPTKGTRAHLYKNGAVLTGEIAGIAACSAWTRTSGSGPGT